MPDRNTWSPWLLIILGGAFVLRLGAGILVQQRVNQTPGKLCLIDGDADGYWKLARKLAQGEDYSVYDPPRRVLRMPGFPLLLAGGITILGERVLGIRMLLAGVGTVACGFVYWLGRELFGHKVALRASLLAALLPTFILFSVLLLSETLFATMLLASLIGMVKLIQSESGSGGLFAGSSGLDNPLMRETAAPKAACRGGYLLSIVTGLLVGLATLVRPTWLLVGPGFAVLYVLAARKRGRALLQAALMMASLGGALLPWTVRNLHVTGHLVPTTLWVGPSLFDGLHPRATGASDMRFVEEDGIYQRMSEYDADQYYRKAALDFARENPGRALWLAVVKLGRFWNPLPNAVQFGHWVIGLTVSLCTLPLLVLAFLGIWHSRRSFWRWVIPAAPVLYFSLVHTVFVSSLRYRLPVEYPLLVLSAVGWSVLVSRVSNSTSS
ncbi:MAG TPA: glycosyltransferase family 39 protein [Planctomycetaceae bacterium]|jgi:4-amino-4-deoxy-L-arabinose transferase-like glycosyltransferase|nr:glycosyltransferase family 39 protein [Planctomycetaceae bacterium]